MKRTLTGLVLGLGVFFLAMGTSRQPRNRNRRRLNRNQPSQRKNLSDRAG